jgi:hypothetical protein
MLLRYASIDIDYHFRHLLLIRHYYFDGQPMLTDFIDSLCQLILTLRAAFTLAIIAAVRWLILLMLICHYATFDAFAYYDIITLSRHCDYFHISCSH